MLYAFWQDEILHHVADWLAAIGTLAAVIGALWLARSDRRQYVHVTVGIRLLVQLGGHEPFPEFLSIRVVNRGTRPVRVTGIGWRGGAFKRVAAVQLFDLSERAANLGLRNPQLPATLEDGAEAPWYVELRDDWQADFASKFGYGTFASLADRRLRLDVASA